MLFHGGPNEDEINAAKVRKLKEIQRLRECLDVQIKEKMEREDRKKVDKIAIEQRLLE
jgi:hypothetical protein